jgi:hypothetical protein
MRRGEETGIMRKLIGGAIVLSVGIGLGCGAPQTPAESAFPRTADGKPDLNGIWQALGTAHWDLEDHSARSGALVPLGAVGAVPPGKSVVQGGAIPYKPEALAKRDENAKNWLTADPEIKCYLPGVPRVMYLPHPFQIVQSTDIMLLASQFAGTTRQIHMVKTEPPPVDSWMGHSQGRWEGDTLIVDSDTFTDQTWFDRAGNYHSAALKVTERIAPMTRDALSYEATIQDDNVFTQPWTISMPLYRRLDKDAEILEFNCVEFVEETLWGHLKKKSTR